jgi:glycine cleavage system H lipoate-binding protein
MFPGVDGFHWTAGHLIFLGVFFSVVIVIAGTVLTASIRAGRHGDAQSVEHLRWASRFHDLPERDRVCRHQLTGEFQRRICKLQFACCMCETHARLAAQQSAAATAGGEENIFGLRFPLDRLYHRGHTWARMERDGTITVGLDDLGRRLVGVPEVLELPPSGSRVEVNGTAWRMEKSGASVRVLSPVAGTIVDTGDPESDWYLKLKPDDTATAHLLRGPEVKMWIGHELEKLQLLMAGAGSGATLADGGVMVEDASLVCPEDKWDSVLAGMFLES